MNQRDKLLSVLDEDLQQDCGDYLALRALMQDLYSRLLERDVPEIDRINLQITVRVEAIAARAQRRSKILAAFRLDTSGVGMRRLLSSCTGARGESLQQHWQQVGDLAVQCQQFNEHNGKLLAMHHDILQQLLAGSQESRLYSPQPY